MRLFATAVVILACSSSVAAQQPANPLAALGIKIVEPMTAAELAAIKAQIAAELASSQMTPFFEDISTPNGGQVRHRQSGLKCPFGKNGQRVQATAQSAVCETIDDGATFRTTVVLAPANTTLASATASAQAAAEREPGYKPFRGPVVTAHPKPGSGQPDHNTIRFFSKAGGQKHAVRLQVGLVRGWLLTSRKETKDFGQTTGMAELLQEATFGVGMEQK